MLGEVAGGEGPTSKGKKGKDEQGKLGVGRQAPAQTVEKVPEAGAGGALSAPTRVLSTLHGTGSKKDPCLRFRDARPTVFFPCSADKGFGQP